MNETVYIYCTNGKNAHKSIPDFIYWSGHIDCLRIHSAFLTLVMLKMYQSNVKHTSNLQINCLRKQLASFPDTVIEF